MKLKRSMLFMTALSLLCCLVGTSELQAQAEKKASLFKPSSVEKKRIRTWQAFNVAFQNRWKVEWNKTTGTPHLIYGHQIPVPESLLPESIEQVTRKYLNRYKDLLQIDLAALVLSKADYAAAKIPGRSTGTWRISYYQNYRGIPVYGGSVQMIVRNNRLTSFGSDYYSEINISTNPKITQEKATQIAFKHMGLTPQPKPLDSKLVIYPSELNGLVKYSLAWQITMPDSSLPKSLAETQRTRPDTSAAKEQYVLVQWQYFIDAIGGGVIKRVNLAKTDELRGNVKGTVHMTGPTDPAIQNISHMTVTLTKDGVSQSTETDTEGNYQFLALTPGNAAIEARLAGPHVQVHNKSTPDSSYSASLTIAGTTTHNWDWTTYDNSPNDIETNAFYHVNLVHDWYTRGTPFDVTPKLDPMVVYLMDLENWWGVPQCNGGAFYNGPISFPVPASCPDFSLCADIVYHEYTHEIVFRIYDDAHIYYFPFYGAMNESLADYFGCSITNNPWHGGGCIMVPVF